jgi:molybdopterin-guanine dinucleotide biosynthesis protein A
MVAWSSLMGVVVLAGGASRRMGTDKLLLRRDGVTLMDTVIKGVRQVMGEHSCPARVIIVGPPRALSPGIDASDIITIQETPPRSGPLHALAASLDYLDDTPSIDSVIAVLAGDSPHGSAALGHLMEALRADVDAVVLVDSKGRRQPLCAIYRVAPLRQALVDIGQTAERSMNDLLGRLTVTSVADTLDAATDIDTPAEAEQFGFSDSSG